MSELAINLMFAISCAPLAFWWCCCSDGGGGGEPGCFVCAPDGLFPRRLQVDITGVAAGGCAECPDINGTWILENPGTGEDICGSCIYDVPYLCSDVPSQLCVTVENIGGFPVQYRLQVLWDSDGTVIWREDTTDKPECMAWDGYEVPPFSGCDLTGATLTLTVIDP